GWAALVDPLLHACVGASLVVYMLVRPGFEDGDLILTTVVVVDLLALVLIAAAAAGSAPAPVKVGLVAAVAMVCLGDGVPAGEAAGLPFLSDAFTPLLWASAAAAVAWAATRDQRDVPDGADAAISPRAAYVRVLLPLVAIVGYPV